MTAITDFIRDQALDHMRIAGRRTGDGRDGDRVIAVFNPATGERLGSVPKASLEEVRQAFETAQAFQPRLTRSERAGILQKAAAIIRERLDDVSRLITAESGLCLKDSVYEAGRVSDVLLFGANEVLRDDGQIFSC